MDDFSNILRIVVATDCHLGYMEKDEVRGQDSFETFDEICSIARQKKVDFVLLGGNLFHENKPSKSTLIKAIEILRKHCLGDQNVQFQVVSEQTMNFANTFGHVNYKDSQFNVSLPVFSIHGNHDGPSEVDNLSALDILSACKLLNYFGKTNLGDSDVGQITLSPIVFRKGSTSVALYGLGNLRDEQLDSMFRTPDAIKWMQPEAEEGCQDSEWFNILVLHQNRAKINSNNAIDDSLPQLLNFVIWGHEPECFIDPQEVPGMNFRVTQPGSTVATLLIEGEAKLKHVLLLEIQGNVYLSAKIPLTSVRPFEYTEVPIKDGSDINCNDQNSILDHLDKVVKNLIEKSYQKATVKTENKLPLVRVKVDYSGFMSINSQRFGEKYVGKVANPQDILIFSKASKDRGEGEINASELLRPEELNQHYKEASVAENDLKRETLPVNDLDSALHKFVNKDEEMAFRFYPQYNLDETHEKITKDRDTSEYVEEDLNLKLGDSLEAIKITGVDGNAVSSSENEQSTSKVADRAKKPSYGFFRYACSDTSDDASIRSDDTKSDNSTDHEFRFQEMVDESINKFDSNLHDKRKESSNASIFKSDSNRLEKIKVLGHFQKFFRVISYLGEGGYGVVFKCRNVLDNKIYAVKKIGYNEAEFNMALSEVIVHSMMDHPHVVRYHQAWTEEGFNQSDFKDKSIFDPKNKLTCTLYIQMEICDGSVEDSMFQQLDAKEKATIYKYMKQIFEGVEHIHSKGIIHADINKNNIFYSKGAMKVGDFGKAKIYGGAPLLASEDDLGFDLYRAPETLQPEIWIDPKIDIYGAGLIFYELAYIDACELERRGALKDIQSGTCVLEGLPGLLLSLDPVNRPTASEAILIFEDLITNGVDEEPKSVSQNYA